MSNIIRLDKAKRAKHQAKAKGKTLCSNGFHRWKVLAERRFDVKSGKLVTAYRCERCGAQKNRAL